MGCHPSVGLGWAWGPVVGALAEHSAVLGSVPTDEESLGRLPDHTIDSVETGRACLADCRAGLVAADGSWPAVSRAFVAGRTEDRRSLVRVLLEVGSLLDQRRDPCHGCSCRCVESVMTLASGVDCQALVDPRACQNSPAKC